jgi:DNA-binding NtrC family response regulator
MKDKEILKRSRMSGSRARVLVVDDDSTVVETLRGILVFEGFDVETTENGKQAIDLVKSPQHFDVLITDMRMPEMNGLELLKAVRQLKKDLPIIILTGYATVENGVDSIEEGAYHYLAKPFHIEELMRTISRAVPKNRPDSRDIGVRRSASPSI